jgi:hypothetical protein
MGKQASALAAFTVRVPMNAFLAPLPIALYVTSTARLREKAPV